MKCLIKTAAAVLMMSILASAAETTVTLQEGVNGYSGTSDTWSSSWEETKSRGSDTLLNIVREYCNS